MFKGFGEPVACGAGRPAFYATVALDGLSVLSNSGIWIDDDGTAATPVVSVAQEGAPAPGTAGAVFHGFSSLAGLDSATEGPVFVARLRSGVGGVDTTNNVGIWARCNDGVVRKLIRTGETLSVGGQPKVVRSIQALLNLPGSSGQARTYVNAGSITYLVTFAGGTQAIVQTTIP